MVTKTRFLTKTLKNQFLNDKCNLNKNSKINKKVTKTFYILLRLKRPIYKGLRAFLTKTYIFLLLIENK